MTCATCKCYSGVDCHRFPNAVAKPPEHWCMEYRAKEKQDAPKPDGDWLGGIKKTYSKLDVDGELIKARAWCDTNRRVCTKRFFVNWLNRAMDKVTPIAGAQSPVSQSVTPVERVQMNAELERCIDQMRVIKATYGDHQTWTQQDVAKYKTLRTRRDELKAKLGVVV